MKFASYLCDGRSLAGLVEGGAVTHLPGLSSNNPLFEAIENGDLQRLGIEASKRAPDTTIQEITFLPVILKPGKIFALGMNYADHAEEGGNKAPDKPMLFSRFSDTLVGHDRPIIRPKISDRFDFEGEIAVIIGQGGRHIGADQALRHVAGYTCFLDGSIRDFQTHSLLAGKNFFQTGAMGPWMVTSEEIDDPANLTSITRLNGLEVQRANSASLVNSIPDTIAYISSFSPLSPGDVIAMGTPGGVGLRRNPQLWMKDGDIIEVEIEKIGTLRNLVVDET